MGILRSVKVHATFIKNRALHSVFLLTNHANRVSKTLRYPAGLNKSEAKGKRTEAKRTEVIMPNDCSF